MKNHNNIHEIIAELAMITELKDGPLAIIKRLKNWCAKSELNVIVTGGAESEVNTNILKTRYSISYPAGIINLSFLFHKLSNRWYLDRLDPA